MLEQPSPNLIQPHFTTRPHLNNTKCLRTNDAAAGRKGKTGRVTNGDLRQAVGGRGARRQKRAKPVRRALSSQQHSH